MVDPPKNSSRRPSKRAEILAAARAQFLERGYDGASIDPITAAAGVSKPTVYAHFPTKEALLEAVVRGEAGDAPRSPAVSHDWRSNP